MMRYAASTTQSHRQTPSYQMRNDLVDDSRPGRKLSTNALRCFQLQRAMRLSGGVSTKSAYAHVMVFIWRFPQRTPAVHWVAACDQEEITLK